MKNKDKDKDRDTLKVYLEPRIKKIYHIECLKRDLKMSQQAEKLIKEWLESIKDEKVDI